MSFVFNFLHDGFCYRLLIIFYKIYFQERYLNVKGLDPDQDWHSVSPDLVPNCLQRLSADSKSG